MNEKIKKKVNSLIQIPSPGKVLKTTVKRKKLNKFS